MEMAVKQQSERNSPNAALTPSKCRSPDVRAGSWPGVYLDERYLNRAIPSESYSRDIVLVYLDLLIFHRKLNMKNEGGISGDTSIAMTGSEGSGEEEKGNTDQLQQPSTQSYTKWQWFLVLSAIYSSSFLYGLDNAIVADIQGAVIDDFGDVGRLGWLAIGFPLGSVATILSFGKMYGVFDMKLLYIISFVMFTAGSALCGGAPTMTALIVGRVWAGAGGAGMYLGVLNLISVSTTAKQRPVYMSINGIVWGAGCILGPIIGGSFADSPATWRWAFYLNLVLFGLFSPVLALVLKPYSFQPDVSLKTKLISLDWMGIALNAALYTVFVLLFTFSGVQWTWSDGRAIALFVAFGVITLSFILSQKFTLLTSKEYRLFPADFLQNKTLVLLYICQSCAATALFVPIYYIPLLFQLVYGDNGVQAAVRLLPLICIGVAANMFQGVVMPRIGFYMAWFLLSSIFSLIAGSLFYSTLDVSTPAARIYGYSVILALGAGLSQTAAYSVAPSKVGPNRVSDAVGFINTAQIGSSVIALTIASAVFQNVGFRRVSQIVNGLGFSSADIQGALSAQRSIVFTQTGPETQQRILEAISRTVNDVYMLVVVAGAVGIIASLLMPREKLIADAVEED